MSRRLLTTTTTLLLLAGLLLCGAGGCSGAQESDGDPTSDMSTASTGEARTTTTEGESAVTAVAPSVTTAGATTASTVVGMELGTRRNPVPLGQEALVGNWKVKVVGATLDATQPVLDENMFNDPPESGSQYVLITLEATYAGEESSTFWIDMMCSFVGGGGNTFDTGMAVAPDPITDQGEAFPGASVAGNLVFLVASDQVSGGTLLLEESFTFEETRVFFAVE